ncbi:MAG TPA: inorganic diphosphatase [Gemmatimonadaceae bacterium]|jgi:inorganic pyrophosphatase
MTRRVPSSIDRLPAFDPSTGAIYAVIECVRSSRNKFKYDPELSLFVHDSTLPSGASYPCDFGFIPSTKGEDGDPIDVLVLMDEPAFIGAVIPARLVGVIEAEQRELTGDVVRNDRLIAAALKSRAYCDVKKLDDLPPSLVDEIEHFWVAYNEIRGKTFTPIGRAGGVRAKHIVEQSLQLRMNS